MRRLGTGRAALPAGQGASTAQPCGATSPRPRVSSSLARTTQVELTNTTFVYEVRDGDDALLVALNLGDEPFARPGGEVLAADDDTRGRSDVAPHGWAIVAP